MLQKYSSKISINQSIHNFLLFCFTDNNLNNILLPKKGTQTFTVCFIQDLVLKNKQVGTTVNKNSYEFEEKKLI